MGRARRKWTAEEDALLRTVVTAALNESRPLLWRELAKDIPGRSNKDCRRRWWNSLAEGTAKGLWSEQEDAKLIQAVKELGTNWRVVAQHVASRTPDQCSSHWTQVLDPEINHCDWTPLEDSQLIQEVHANGTNWTTIAAFHTPRRTTLALKNRYSTLRLKLENRKKRSLSSKHGSAEVSRLATAASVSKTDSMASPTSSADSSYEDEDDHDQAAMNIDSYDNDFSDTFGDDIESMTTGTSRLGSTSSTDMDLESDWSSMLDTGSNFNATTFIDRSVLSDAWKKDSQMAYFEDNLFDSIDPSMSLGTDVDPFSLIRDPLVLYSEPIEPGYDFNSSKMASFPPMGPSSMHTSSTASSAQTPTHAGLPDMSAKDSSMWSPYQLSLDMTCSKSQLESLMGLLAGSGANFTVKSKSDGL